MNIRSAAGRGHQLEAAIETIARPTREGGRLHRSMCAQPLVSAARTDSSVMIGHSPRCHIAS
jgi:hypothetical protein